MKSVYISAYRRGVTSFYAGFAVMSLSGSAIAASEISTIDEATQSLDLSVGGYIGSHCYFELVDEFIRLELTDHAGSASVDFSLDCNIPLTFSIESENGALNHTAGAGSESYPGFQSRLPYNVDINIDVSEADLISFLSEDIRANPATGTLNVIPYNATGQVRLNWILEAPLLAGEYNDIIRIRVTGDGGTESQW